MRKIFLLAIIILSGCATTPPQIFENPFKNGQLWQGQYTCSQGTTDLTVKINLVETGISKFDYGEGYGMGGVLKFKHRKTEGAFLVKGAFFTHSNDTALNGYHWIKRPNNYKMVNLSGDVSEDGKVFSGKVIGPGCSTFRLRLVDKNVDQLVTTAKPSKKTNLVSKDKIKVADIKLGMTGKEVTKILENQGYSVKSYSTDTEYLKSKSYISKITGKKIISHNVQDEVGVELTLPTQGNIVGRIWRRYSFIHISENSKFKLPTVSEAIASAEKKYGKAVEVYRKGRLYGHYNGSDVLLTWIRMPKECRSFRSGFYYPWGLIRDKAKCPIVFEMSINTVDIKGAKGVVQINTHVYDFPVMAKSVLDEQRLPRIYKEQQIEKSKKKQLDKKSLSIDL